MNFPECVLLCLKLRPGGGFRKRQVLWPCWRWGRGAEVSGGEARVTSPI